MKRIIALLSWLALVAGTGCYEKSGTTGAGTGPMLRYHFAGFTDLAGGATNSRLQNVAAAPATDALRRDLAQKLAKAPALYWQKQLPAGAADPSALFLPLFEDLIALESAVEVRGSPTRPELTLAAALTEERARLWSTNLWQIATAWKLGNPRPAVIGGSNGWEAATSGATLQFVRAGKWVVVGLGRESAKLLTTALQQISAGAPPVSAGKNLVAELEADFPRLTGLFPGLTSFGLPATHLTMTNRGESVRTEARLTFSEKIPWTFEPWKIPTNLISEPLNSFTVGQGLAPLLPRIKGLSEMGLKTYPNQFCAWGLNYEQGQISLTAPVPHAATAMNQISAGLPKALQTWFQQTMGEFYFVSNRAEFLWSGIPFVTPFVRPATNAGQEFIHFGMLPTPKKEPAPPEMFGAFANRTNLLYWDFEITGQRVLHGLQFYQLADILSHHGTVTTNLPTQFWMTVIAPLLGETVTEVALTAPRELTLVRKSHLGFTGFELASLMHWIESPGFPFAFKSSTRLIPAVKPDARPKPAATNSPAPKKP